MMRVRKRQREMLEVDYCCFCVDLRIGSLAVGYITLLWRIVQVSLGIVDLAKHSAPMYQIENYTTEIEKQIDVIISAILVTMFILNLLFTILLLVGIHKHHRSYVKGYLLFTSVYFLICVSGFISHFFLGSLLVGKIIREAIDLALTAYSLLVIRSFFLKMESMVRNRPVMYNASTAY